MSSSSFDTHTSTRQKWHKTCTLMFFKETWCNKIKSVISAFTDKHLLANYLGISVYPFNTCRVNVKGNSIVLSCSLGEKSVTLLNLSFLGKTGNKFTKGKIVWPQPIMLHFSHNYSNCCQVITTETKHLLAYSFEYQL